LMRFR